MQYRKLSKDGININYKDMEKQLMQKNMNKVMRNNSSDKNISNIKEVLRKNASSDILTIKKLNNFPGIVEKNFITDKTLCQLKPISKCQTQRCHLNKRFKSEFRSKYSLKKRAKLRYNIGNVINQVTQCSLKALPHIQTTEELIPEKLKKSQATQSIERDINVNTISPLRPLKIIGELRGKKSVERTIIFQLKAEKPMKINEISIHGKSFGYKKVAEL